jgi:hypothetical protein
VFLKSAGTFHVTVVHFGEVFGRQGLEPLHQLRPTIVRKVCNIRRRNPPGQRVRPQQGPRKGPALDAAGNREAGAMIAADSNVMALIPYGMTTAKDED